MSLVLWWNDRYYRAELDYLKKMLTLTNFHMDQSVIKPEPPP
jgi:hypothetical protein